jgi:hypothetical protein
VPAAQANKLANEKARCLEEINIALFLVICLLPL